MGTEIFKIDASWAEKLKKTIGSQRFCRQLYISWTSGLSQTFKPPKWQLTQFCTFIPLWLCPSVSKSIRFSRVTKKNMFKISICQDFTTSTPNPDSALEGYKTYPGPGHRKKVRHVSDIWQCHDWRHQYSDRLWVAKTKREVICRQSSQF